jgi:hypothetical protein
MTAAGLFPRLGALGDEAMARKGQRALFGLLRESRTGWIHLPQEVQDSLVAAGQDSVSWLVRREADGLAGQ